MKPESDTQYVTIPYFHYEAMARVYYTRINGDFPVSQPIASEDPSPKFMGNFTIEDDEIPETWKPQGVARKTPIATQHPIPTKES